LSLRPWLVLWAGLLCACPRAAIRADSPLLQAQDAGEAMRLFNARRPERFKMVHQVAARYAGQTFVMTGYLLGRADGSFRVSASAPIGPRLFDVGRLDGRWQAKVHLQEISQRLDPKNMATAISRIYFSVCKDSGERQGELFVYRCPVEGDDEADALEMTLDGHTLSPVSKRFTLKGKQTVAIRYSEPEAFGQEWQARKVSMDHYGGMRLDVALVEYQPGFAFEDALLDVER